MKRLLVGVVGVLVLVGAGLGAMYMVGVRDDAAPLVYSAAAGDPPDARVERGRYLARLGNCAACHTVAGGQPYAGGTAIPTAFGTLYGPNISSDPEHGIGSWTEDDFWQALHNGKAPDGTLLYPAFPFTEYTRMPRDDADALFAFLRTVPASDQASRPHDLAFPYDQRVLLAFWRALYFKAGTLASDTTQSLQWNRGRYLVEGPGHCAACHTARNSLGASVGGAPLGGAMIDGLGWYAPPLTGDTATGLGQWSHADIAALLTTGVSSRGAAAGPMVEVVAGSTQYLSTGDADAIAHYLKLLPAGASASKGARPSQATMDIGAQRYRQYCVQCHQANGEGSGTAWPPLAGNLSVTAPSPINAIRVVLDGGYAPSTAANPRPHGMPPYGQMLNDNDIAALTTYIRNSWGNEASAVTSLEVKRARGQ